MNRLDQIRTTFGFAPKESAVSLGRGHGFPWRKEWLTESQLNHHVHIVGASGFGKTVLLSHIVQDRIAKGKGLLFIDLKGDRETIEQFTAFVRDAGRLQDLKVLSLSEHEASTGYNLLSRATANQLRDKVMKSLEWSEEFYKNQASGFLLKVLTGLCWLRDNKSQEFGLHELHACVDKPKAIQKLLTEMPLNSGRARVMMEEVFTFLSSTEDSRSISGLRVQLESILYSDFGDRFTKLENTLDLFETVRSGKIAFVFLDSRRYGETAKVVGRFIIEDLKSVSAKIDAEIPRSDRKPFTVIIDEFSDLAGDDFISLLDRARSSRIGIVLAHQEISDLDRISPEFCGRLMGNTATMFAFLQKRPQSAELIAGIGGTRTVKKKTAQYETKFFIPIPTGIESVRETDEFIIHPNIVKSLRVGECVRIGRYPRASANRILVRRK